ncbi:MAG: DUF6883 domain-containing protein [Gemmatimonadaceae bacterium]
MILQLPNAERALIDPAKLRDYLLSFEQPVGRAKARFFGTLGFSREEWPSLERALRAHDWSGEVTPMPPTKYGQKYEVRAILQGLSGRDVPVETVWIVLTGEEIPRLVTGCPGDTL